MAGIRSLKMRDIPLILTVRFFSFLFFRWIAALEYSINRWIKVGWRRRNQSPPQNMYLFLRTKSVWLSSFKWQMRFVFISFRKQKTRNGARQTSVAIVFIFLFIFRWNVFLSPTFFSNFVFVFSQSIIFLTFTTPCVYPPRIFRLRAVLFK